MNEENKGVTTLEVIRKCQLCVITARKWSLRRLCFSHLSVSHSVHKGGMRGWAACMAGGGMRGWGYGEEVCVARGGIRARGYVLGACVAGGMEWGGVCGQGGVRAGEHAWYACPPPCGLIMRDTVGQCAGSTHPTGMFSFYPKYQFDKKIRLFPLHLWFNITFIFNTMPRSVNRFPSQQCTSMLIQDSPGLGKSLANPKKGKSWGANLLFGQNFLKATWNWKNLTHCWPVQSFTM